MTMRLVATVSLGAILTLAGCSSGPTRPCSPFGTSVCGAQATNVARDVARWHNIQHQACPFVRPVSAQIVGKEGGSVIEHWTVEACEGKHFTYRAYLMPGRGAFSVMVSDVRPDERGVAP